MARRNPVAKDLRTVKYRPRVVKSPKTTYRRRPKHPARAADCCRGPGIAGGVERPVLS